jgi:hypothetical protein
MPVKKKALKKSAKKGFRKQSSSSRLKQLAKVTLPQWRIVSSAQQDSPTTFDPDAVSPNLSKLQGKKDSSVGALYKGSDYPATEADEHGTTGLVNMEPADGHAGAGPKTQVFENDEHTGSQG